MSVTCIQVAVPSFFELIIVYKIRENSKFFRNYRLRSIDKLVHKYYNYCIKTY